MFGTLADSILLNKNDDSDRVQPLTLQKQDFFFLGALGSSLWIFRREDRCMGQSVESQGSTV